MMRRFLQLLSSLFDFRPNPTSRRNLLGMYLGESNSPGHRKPNRDRA